MGPLEIEKAVPAPQSGMAGYLAPGAARQRKPEVSEEERWGWQPLSE